MRLDLWNAELKGTIKTRSGGYRLRALTHRQLDVILVDLQPELGESIRVTWHPANPIPPVWATLQDWKKRGKKSNFGKRFLSAPMPMPPKATITQEGKLHLCYQPLYQQRGETTTGWIFENNHTNQQRLLVSIHHSFPQHDSRERVRNNLNRAITLLEEDQFIRQHRQWWHDYYRLSFLSFNDPEKEAFYWIQMYKLASAMRQDGPILDLMGPWYHKTFWPMVWGDLNVELIYWTHLTANRMAIGESLPNNLDKYAHNLENNVPPDWKDSASIGAAFPQDLISDRHRKVPDMLAWILHNYWLHCRYAGDRERLRDKFFPLLRKTVNAYLNYLRENPVKADDGKIHIKNSWSPEYPGGHGQDINFTIALIRWSCQTLLQLNREFNLHDPLAGQWQHLLDNLVDFQIDENGLRIGKDIPFAKPHRHYSHLLAFYPLALITPQTPENARLLRKSVDHWLNVSFYGKNETKAMAYTGYTLTGAASMYAWLGDGEAAIKYLDQFINHKRVSPTTMYAEGNPVIESPLSYATAIHEMILQSWGGRIRVFKGVPRRWSHIEFRDLRTQGAFLLTAQRSGGRTRFVLVKSLKGNPCIINPDIDQPDIYIDNKPASTRHIQRLDNGFWKIELKAGSKLIFVDPAAKQNSFRLEPVPVQATQQHLFGLNTKTRRLEGHKFYYRE